MATKAPEFAHLHVHSEYSMLDGHSKLTDLVKEAKKLGMESLALTDHGVLYGALEFYDAAREAGIKPIIGVEAYVAARKHTDKETLDRSSNHLILLAQNEIGYRNLLALTTRAHLDGFYYKPRIDHDLFAQRSEGIVALSGCASGEVAWALRNDDYAKARKAAEFYLELLGRDRYYLELQNHGIDFQAKINEGVLQLSRDLDLQVVCTNDSHYTRREDCAGQDLLLCIQTNSQLDDPKRMKAYTPDHYLKSPSEMFQLFGDELPQSLKNTVAIAESCNLELNFGRLDFPKLSFIPEGESPMDYLSRTCWDNLPRKYEHVTTEIEERLRYELDVVQTTGFPAYILFVWDFVKFARGKGILCGPRGSAAGSIILYLLGITTIEPLANGLTFERFLNIERIQMPDIDMDFADSRREEVIEYVSQTYGRDHVAQIISFGRLLARAAIRDTGRALGYPLSEVDRVAKLIPTIPVGMTLDKALATTPELKQLYDEEDHIRRLIDSARTVEGITRHASTHAAGIVVSGEPLEHHVPLQRATKGENVIMTQYEMHAVEHIGLLKMDFLGLTNLTLLENALNIIEQTRGVRLDLQQLPMDDPGTMEMLSRGDSTGVFQLEGSGMRRTLREFRPTTVHHLAAIVALYRPGPMAHIPTYVAAKDGRQPITFLHPNLEPILGGTYGVIVYQDQVLQIVQAIAGYSLGQADVLRRAMGKKIAEEMKRNRDKFLQGAAEKDVDPAAAAKIWEYIEPFAGYAFNRAHAYCYAYIAYQTAYLKYNYPAEYMAAMLSTQSDDTEKVIAAAGECRRLGIPLLAPDVNRSLVAFSVEPNDSPGERALQNGATGDIHLSVRFGLGAVKNVGAGAAAVIVEAREKGGPFKSLDDLCQRVDLRSVNKRVLEALTKAGALDHFGPRERVLAGLDRAMSAGQQAQKAAEIGQGSLFGLDDNVVTETALPLVAPLSDQQRLSWEKESLGFFLSNHPFEAAARALANIVTTNTSQVTEEMADQRVTLAGAIMSVRKIVTKKGESMVVAHIEDLHGGIEAIVFPRAYSLSPEIWSEDNIVIVRGKIQVKKMDSTSDEEARGIPEILVDGADEWVPTAADLEPIEIDAPVLLDVEEMPWSEPDEDGPSSLPPTMMTRVAPIPPSVPTVAPTMATAPAMAASPQSAVAPSIPTGTIAAAPSASRTSPPTTVSTGDSPARVVLPSAALPPAANTPPISPVAVLARELVGAVHEEGATSYVVQPADSGSADDWSDAPIAPLQSAASEIASLKHLVILFQAGSDPDEDLRRLRQLHSAVITHPGRETFEILFHGAGGRRKLIGETLSVGYSAELAQEIEAILGSGALQLSERPG